MGRGLLLILSAPSGAGKTTLARRLVEATPGAVYSISTTTRAPRGQERDGHDYHFVDDSTFDRLISEGAFLEWAEVHGARYATSRAVVDNARRNGTLALFDIDVQGGSAIKRACPDAVRALILPPSLAELERRLRARKTDSEKSIQRRLEMAQQEIALCVAAGYEYWVVNDDLDQAFDLLSAIVAADQARAGVLNLKAMNLLA